MATKLNTLAKRYVTNHGCHVRHSLGYHRETNKRVEHIELWTELELQQSPGRRWPTTEQVKA